MARAKEEKVSEEETSQAENNTKVIPDMSLTDLLEMMKAGKAYIVPNEKFILELIGVVLKSNIKIQYRVVSANEDLPLNEETETTLHELFMQVPLRISHWVKRGVDDENKVFIEFELVMQRQSEQDKDQLTLTDGGEEVPIPVDNLDEEDTL